MMKRRTGRRILSVLLALVMMLSLLPASVFASDTVTAKKISSADQLTSGQYVLVNEAGYAPTVLDGGWVTHSSVLRNMWNSRNSCGSWLPKEK